MSAYVFGSLGWKRKHNKKLNRTALTLGKINQAKQKLRHVSDKNSKTKVTETPWYRNLNFQGLCLIMRIDRNADTNHAKTGSANGMTQKSHHVWFKTGAF